MEFKILKIAIYLHHSLRASIFGVIYGHNQKMIRMHTIFNARPPFIMPTHIFIKKYRQMCALIFAFAAVVKADKCDIETAGSFHYTYT